MNTLITFCSIRFNGIGITAGFVDDISKKAWLIHTLEYLMADVPLTSATVLSVEFSS